MNTNSPDSQNHPSNQKHLVQLSSGSETEMTASKEENDDTYCIHPTNLKTQNNIRSCPKYTCFL